VCWKVFTPLVAKRETEREKVARVCRKEGDWIIPEIEGSTAWKRKENSSRFELEEIEERLIYEVVGWIFDQLKLYETTLIPTNAAQTALSNVPLIFTHSHYIIIIESIFLFVWIGTIVGTIIVRTFTILVYEKAAVDMCIGWRESVWRTRTWEREGFRRERILFFFLVFWSLD
jgi:hypothetical protein